MFEIGCSLPIVKYTHKMRLGGDSGPHSLTARARAHSQVTHIVGIVRTRTEPYIIVKYDGFPKQNTISHYNEDQTQAKHTHTHT